MQERETFQAWLETTHGKEVYGLFAQFAGQWRQTGRDKCAASLIVN